MKKVVCFFVVIAVIIVAACGSYVIAANPKAEREDNPAVKIAAVYEKGAKKLEKAKTQNEVLSIFLDVDLQATKISTSDPRFKPTPAQQKIADQAYHKFRKALKQAQSRCKE